MGSMMTYMTFKVRMHIHFKIYVFFIYTQYFFFLMARFPLLAYQSGIWEYTTPEETPLIIVCSMIRIYYLVLLLTLLITSLAFERECALYYVRDYEKHHRPWIPFLLIIWSISICTLSSCVYTFELLTIVGGAAILAVIAAIAFMIYLYNYRKTWLLNNSLKRRKPCGLKYTLSVRYQLEENLWVAEMLESLTATIFVVIVADLVSFFCTISPFLEEDTRHILDCLFNCLLASEGTLIPLGALVYNKYLIRLVKGVLFGPEESELIDEGDSYFEQLLQQWDEPVEQKKKKRTLLMKLLRLHE